MPLDSPSPRSKIGTLLAHPMPLKIVLFHRYVDDEDHEIRTSAYDSDERDSNDLVVEHTMRWRPTVEELCEDYELDQRICDDDGDHYDDDDYKTFSFDLICMVEQDGLDDDYNQQKVEVSVWDGGGPVARTTAMTVCRQAAAVQEQKQQEKQHHHHMQQQQ